VASREYPLEPVEVPPVETAHRRICTPIPVPESVEVLRALRAAEPRSMGGQAPVIWERGEGSQILDPYGNRWLDFSAGVLVTAAGHGHPRVSAAIEACLRSGVHHAYSFPTGVRARLAAKLRDLAPHPLEKVFLLTTGSEATECCIKLARTHGVRAGGARKRVFVTFDNAFHGRTMGAQLAGGSPSLKDWIGGANQGFVQVPFPDGFRQADTSFAVFETRLAEQGVEPRDVCGVMAETYQGCNACLMPAAYARALRAWCDSHGALMILDEVQAGFGRTGRWFGFEHCGVVPDLAAFGKGISGGMPLSSVIGRADVMDLYGPGEMTSTHSANPLCCAAALANIEVIEQERLVDNAARLEPLLLDGARRAQKASQGRIGRVDGAGLVAALQFTHPGTTRPDPDTAFDAYRRAIESGVMLFSPVGVGGCCIKVNPPLVITEEALREGLDVIVECVLEATARSASSVV
jgi:4-aminobutyrate aminotransferase / (S)-3-amino-2-methylpropionate transaminase / 5-aminovalerate transaminase